MQQAGIAVAGIDLERLGHGVAGESGAAEVAPRRGSSPSPGAASAGTSRPSSAWRSWR